MTLTEIENEVLTQLIVSNYERALPRKALAEHLRHKRVLISQRDDRAMRQAIEGLRNKGYLVCHRKGKAGGYFLATAMDEYLEFRQREYKSRIVSLSNTMRKMDKTAELTFSDEVQLELFYL